MSPRGARGPTEEELAAQVAYAAERLALYRRRIYAGRGDPKRLAELERELHGAQLRQRAAKAPVSTSV